MLETLKLRNFKAFKTQEIPLRPLTLLTGLNGMGKSSVLQALLLLRQSYLGQTLLDQGDGGLMLNGELVQLGTGRDILFDNAETDQIVISIDFNGGNRTTWRFAYDRETDILSHSHMKQSLDIYPMSLFTTMFHYLQAERVGPRTAFEIADHMVRQRHQMGKR